MMRLAIVGAARTKRRSEKEKSHHNPCSLSSAGGSARRGGRDRRRACCPALIPPVPSPPAWFPVCDPARSTGHHHHHFPSPAPGARRNARRSRPCSLRRRHAGAVPKSHGQSGDPRDFRGRKSRSGGSHHIGVCIAVTLRSSPAHRLRRRALLRARLFSLHVPRHDLAPFHHYCRAWPFPLS